ncbi:exopolysaccharide biosynthesis polyprenyl glycosylphosphotransferase [Streptomyces sp. NPDC050504]|uniref:exopolysaccharide biosynthesis polyprenyl glycosylphosphotransferase n=1 Tax=Streptomyces sp. NPDC050504 TaxID=3365618 RepID=UPI0037BBA9A6
MTTDSSRMPSQSTFVPSVAPQRARRTSRRVLPARPQTPAASTAAPLIAADCTAVLLAGTVLEEAQRGGALLLQLTVLAVLLNVQARLYRDRVLPSVLDELPVLAGRIAVVWCGAAALSARGPLAGRVDLADVAGTASVHLAVVCSLRWVIFARRRRRLRARPRSALVLGTVPAAQRVCALLGQHPEYGLRPVGTVAWGKGAAQQAAEGSALPVLTSEAEMLRAIIQNSVRDVLFAPAEGEQDRTGMIELLHRYGCTVWLLGAPVPGQGTAVPGQGTAPRMGAHLWGYGFRRLEPPSGDRPGLKAKRALDAAAAGLLLVCVLPLLLVCAAAVRLSDGPGVLFRQERVGQHGRLFVLLKFRTLRPADDREANTKWSVAHDARMSPVGRFLRRSSLDELPQLWNVVRGDMSLVGPRPERPYFVAQFSRAYPGYAARHRMTVGLTGLAQVNGLRGDTSIEERCRFDNHYIDQWSLWQDMCILLRTALSLIRPTGS